ncbi:MAG TPA: PIN domain-containing protein [bacterium]|nr:PIN domain-containing protein [bacterium]
MAVLIDTSVFIALERRGMPFAPTDMRTVSPGERVAIAAITASELLAGVRLSTPVERRVRREAYVENILGGVAVMPFDLAVARVHAGLAVDLTRRGSRIGANDLLIAATGLTYHHAVLTANAREFRHVPGLEVRTLTLS